MLIGSIINPIHKSASNKQDKAGYRALISDDIITREISLCAGLGTGIYHV